MLQHYSDQMTLIQYLKSAPSEDLVQCHFAQNWGLTIRPEWGPTIENEHAKIPFITQSADEMYNSGKAPAIDVLFSFTSQVCLGRQTVNHYMIQSNRNS